MKLQAKKQGWAHHSWKFAACVESQKSMPSTAVAVSPAGSSSVGTQRQQNKESGIKGHLFKQQLFELGLNLSSSVDCVSVSH